MRRYLTVMQQNGHVARTYGGALVTSFKEQPFTLSQHLNQDAKAAIAKRALTFAQTCDIIFVDAGTTCMALASSLDRETPRTVITRGLDTANVLVDNPAVEVVLLGGTIRKLSHGLVGPLSTQANARLSYDAAFLGADVIDPGRGLGEPTIEETAIKEAVSGVARKVFVLADSSKAIGPLAHAWLPFRTEWVLITDDKLSHQDISLFACHIQVETVTCEGSHALKRSRPQPVDF